MTTAPAPEPNPDELVQVNVRVPRSLRDAVDERRAAVGESGISRDKWVARALTWALRQPQTRPTPTAPGQRTGTPPHRR